MNNANKALDLLRNELRGDDLQRLTPEQLRQMEAICTHWAAMARATQQNNTAASR
ncbi:hypothetical protein [Denitromonas sp.]|uniref:hypothetical protein n=1 Tax=Denitromonas sp. TaxID=2734609 RepID=UPI003A8B1C4F